MPAYPVEALEMKWRIQEEMAKEYAGLSMEEFADRMHEKVMTSDSPLARCYQQRLMEQARHAAETPPNYTGKTA